MGAERLPTSVGGVRPHHGCWTAPRGRCTARLDAKVAGLEAEVACVELGARLGSRLGLLWQTEHPLTDDVALDLGRATPDRLRSAEEKGALHA